MALAAAGGPPLPRESNAELESILGHTPLKENEGGWGGRGGYGYAGVGQSPSGAPYNGRSHEEWELSTTHLHSDPYHTPTQQTFTPPQHQWQSPAFPSPSSADQRPAGPSSSSPPRKADVNAPSTGLRNVGVTLTDHGPTRTVSVGSKKSVEMHSGHGIGRSFRASVEGEDAYSSDPRR